MLYITNKYINIIYLYKIYKQQQSYNNIAYSDYKQSTVIPCYG